MTAFKRTLSFLLVLVMVLSLIPAAYAIDQPEPVDFSTDEAIPTNGGPCGADGAAVTWALYDDGSLVISGNGAMADYNVITDATAGEAGIPWYDFRASITSITIENGVTHVGNYAFLYCGNTVSVNIADSVQTIGSYAFEHCGLTDLDLGTGVTYIGESAFFDCSELTSATIPNSVDTIDEYAFSRCENLDELDLGKGVTTIKWGAFRNCKLTELVIPDSVTTLGKEAFRYCETEKLTIGKGVTEIPAHCFQEGNFTEVEIPGTVKSISTCAFSNCYSLEKVTLNEGLEEIHQNMFANCPIRSIELPTSIRVFYNYAFEDCTSLSRAIFKGDAPPIFQDDVFNNCAPDFTIYYPEGSSGWSTPTWKGYPAYPYNSTGELPETWPVNKDSHVIIVVDSEVGSDGEVFPIVGATVKILTRSGTVQTGTTDANGQFAYYGSDGLELRIEADGYQIRRSAYTMKTGESRLFALDPLSGDGAPYFSMLCAKAATGESPRNVDLRTDAVSYTEGGGSGLKLMFEVAVDENIIALDSVELYQVPVGYEHEGKSMRFMYTGDQKEFHIEDGTFDNGTRAEKLYQIAPGQFRSQEQIYAVIHYRIKGGDSTIFSTTPIPLSLNIVPQTPITPSTEESSVDLTPGTTSSGSISWLDNVLVNCGHALFSTFLGTDPSVESELLNFSYTVETDTDTGNRKLRFAIGLAEGTETYNLLTNKVTENESQTAYQLLRDWIDSKELKKGKPLDFLSSKVGKTVKDEFKRTRVKAVGEIEVELIGYYEVEIDADGVIVPDSGHGRLLVNACAKGTQGKTVLVHGFPLYYEAVVAAEFAADMEPVIHNLAGTAAPQLGLEAKELELTIPKLSLEGGIGVRGVATVGVGGVFENVITTTIGAAESTTKMVGSTNAYFRVYIAFLLDYKENFGTENHGKVTLYDTSKPNNGNAVSYANGQSLAQQALAEPELTLNERSYLQNETRWNGNPIQLMNADPLVTLQNGVLPNAMPRLHTLGDRQIMLFLADDASRALGSHTRLMYTVRESGVWSEPAAVWASDTGDLYFDSAVIDGQLYVAWQKCRGAVTGEDAMAMLDSLSGQSEICLARWDNGASAFTDQQYLTDDATLDMMASVCPAEGGVQVTWVSNDENNALGTGGSYTIHTLSVTDGAPGEVCDLYTTDAYLTELTTAVGADGLHVLFATLDEENRTDLNHLSPDGLTTPMTDSACAGLTTVDGRFLWQDDGVLWRLSPALDQYESMIAPESGALSSSYRYVSNGQQEAVVWCEGQEPCRILASIYANGRWSEPIVLLDNIPQTVTFLDAALTADGSFLLVTNTVDLTGGDDSTTALKTALITPACDVSVRSAAVERADPETDTQTITVIVENPGLVAVDALTVTVSGGGALLLDQEYPVELAPGGVCTVTSQLDVSQITALTEVDVQAQASSDANPADNHASVTVGHTDTALSLDVHDLGDHVIFLLSASNGSHIPTDANIRVLLDGLDGEEAAVLELGTLTLGENVQYLYTLDKTTVNFGDRDRVYYLFSLESDETDWDLSDNVCAYGVEKPLIPEYPADSESEDLVIVQPESIRIQNGDVHFTSPGAEPVVLTAVITPEDSSVTEVDWSVADPRVACVLPDGTLLPGSAGTTTLTATLGGDLSDSITVTVDDPVESHTPALDLGIDATCTDCGWTDGVLCQDCGEILTARQPIAPLGHIWKGTACQRCGEARVNPFVDVPGDSFYLDPVLWAVEQGITNGTDATHFSPNSECQRAVVVTFLWRAAGKPEPVCASNPFVDVKESDFFYKAVLWAAEQGITNGLDATHFGPYGLCNRAQVVTFLWRAIGSPEPAAADCPFTDVDTSLWYGKDVLWAVENGVTNGMSASTFGVNAICNRAQIVTFLYRTFA